MSTITRTLRNLRKIGIRDYLHQMMYIGDTKAGTFIAKDRYGNKYYENLEQELPRSSFLWVKYLKRRVVLTAIIVRTRWVDYKDHEYSPYVQS